VSTGFVGADRVALDETTSYETNARAWLAAATRRLDIDDRDNEFNELSDSGDDVDDETVAGRQISSLRWSEIALLTLTGLVESAATFALILAVRQSVDRLASVGGSGAPLKGPIVNTAAAVFVIALAKGVEYTLSEYFGYRHVHHLRVAVYDKLTCLPLRTVSSMSKGAILLRLTGDLSSLRAWISRGLCRLIAAVASMVGILVALTMLGVEYATIVLGPVLVLFALSTVMGHRIRRATRGVRWRRSLLTSNIAEQISAMTTVRAFGRVAGERQRVAEQSESLNAAQARAAWARGRLRFVTTLASYVGLPFVLIVAAKELPRGATTVGEVFAAMTAARLLGTPLRTIGRSYEYRQAASVSSGKLADFLGRSEEQQDLDDAPSIRIRKGNIEVVGLSVEGALDNVSFTAAARRTIAVVGPNGAGKSTLAAAMAGLVVPDAGAVVIDDQDVSTITKRSLYRSIGFVSADTPLLRGSLHRNLTYRDRLAAPEEVQRVSLLCRVGEVTTEQHADGEVWIEEGGRNLSVGARQRVALARAMLGNPPLLILDEPTAHLDAGTREVFHQAIARYGGTVIWMTNQPSEALRADCVLVLDSGRVAAVLTPSEYRDRLLRSEEPSFGILPW
jgi:ATP-binding cassette, subfamily B, bacterial